MALNLLSYRLASVRRAMGRRQALSLGARALGCLGCFCVLLDLWERLFGLREGAAAAWTGAGFLASITGLSWLLSRRVFRTRPGDLLRMAEAVEARRPELEDSYYAAVELEGSGRALRPLESLLLRRMQGRDAGDPGFLAGCFARELSWRGPAAWLLAMAVAWAAAALSGNVLVKARCRWRDLRSGGCSGLRVHVPGTEHPLHSDVRVTADILRWEREAWIEIEDPRGRRQTLPMTDSLSGTSCFTFYDLAENRRFRILTPSLRSGWRTLAVYTPPEYDRVRLTAVPPAYARRKPRTWSRLQDIEVVAGSVLRLQVDTPPGIAASLRHGDAAPAASRRSPHRFETVAARSERYALVLEDGAGHRTEPPSFRVEAVPDLPPVIELREPGPDTRVRAGDSVRLECLVGDDFGVGEVRLRFSVSGGPRRTLPLLRPESGRARPEEEVVHVWDLPGLGVKDGDLLACFVEAADNRAPLPQWSRSGVFFLTVRPREDLLEEEPGRQGRESGGEFDVSDLIAENKRLLRLALDSAGAGAADRKRGRFELHRDLNELSLEVGRRLNRLVEMSQGRPQPGLPELFRRSAGELGTAAGLAGRMLFEESLPPQERSLAALARIENELLRNSLRRKQGQDGGEAQGRDGGQENKEDAAAGKAAPQDGGRAAREELARLKDMLGSLRRLADGQQDFAERCGEAAALPAVLAREQEGLRKRTEALREQAKAVPAAGRCGGHLERAGQEMEHGIRALEDGRPAAGGIHAARGLRHLQGGVRSLESAIRKASADQVERLAEAAAGLAESQREQAARSRELAGKGGDPGQAKEQRERQKGITSRTRGLGQEIRELAALLEKDFPEAAADMRKRLDESAGRGLERAQKKAGNALLYRRFEAAARSQREAADLLQGLAQGLHASAGRMPPVSSDELRDALEQLQRSADRIAAAGSDPREERSRRRIGETRRQAGGGMRALAEALRDQELMDLADMLLGPDGGRSARTLADEGLRLLKASAAVLLKHLQAMDMRERLRLSRDQALPPEKYRRQVREYFRDLGEEE